MRMRISYSEIVVRLESPLKWRILKYDITGTTSKSQSKTIMTSSDSEPLIHDNYTLLKYPCGKRHFRNKKMNNYKHDQHLKA